MLFRPLDGWADLDVRVKRGADGEPEGVVEGIAVPWDKPTKIYDGLIEEFARGAFDQQIARPQSVFLARDHMPRGGALIGRLTAMRNDAAGLWVSGRVSKTPVGLETLTLLGDGVLDSFSIGFVEGKNSLRQAGKDEITRRETAGLREVAIVPHPAYAGAKITGVRGTCPLCGDGGADEDETAETATRASLEALIASIPTLPPVPRRANPRR
jgi:HK97 family phage prohead protease